MKNKHECCTPEGQVPRYVDCVGCDKKPIEIMENKQSSIEWYAKASHELIVKKSNGEITEREFLTMHHNLFYEAEAMHKEEIVESHHEGYYSFSHSGEQYYNETFGGETD